MLYMTIILQYKKKKSKSKKSKDYKKLKWKT